MPCALRPTKKNEAMILINGRKKNHGNDGLGDLTIIRLYLLHTPLPPEKEETMILCRRGRTTSLAPLTLPPSINQGAYT